MRTNSPATSAGEQHPAEQTLEPLQLCDSKKVNSIVITMIFRSFSAEYHRKVKEASFERENPCRLFGSGLENELKVNNLL